MSDLTNETSDRVTPTEKQTEQAFASQSLQVGISQFKEITGGTNSNIEAAGFASNDQLLADLAASENVNTNEAYSTPSNQELLDQFHKDYAKDTSPQSLQHLRETSLNFMSTEEIKDFLDKRVSGQEKYLASLTPEQLKVVGDLAGAIQSNDLGKLAAILKDTPPLITRHIAPALQYDLQTKGMYRQVGSVIEDDRAYLTLQDRKTQTITKIDMQTGISSGPQPFEEIPTK